MILKVICPDGSLITQKLSYTEQELAEALCSNTRLIGLLRKLGALEGIYLGNKYIYTAEQVEEFLHDYRGYDLTNEYTIAEAVRQVRKTKRLTVVRDK